MIVKVEMYTVICDNCKKYFGSEGDYSCWNDDHFAEDNAMDSDWLKIDDCHYCTDCHSIGDDDELVIDPKRTNEI